MSFKRARAELASAAYSISTDDLLAEDELEQRKTAGEEFRDFLIQRYTHGTFSAADTCLLAHYHSQSGGLGADELALNPRHASRHAAEHCLHCCPCCFAKKTELTKVGHFSLRTCPYPEFDDAAYAATLARNFKDK